MKSGRYNISFEEYLADPCDKPSLSRSTIIDLLDSPARAWFNHPRLNPNPPERKAKNEFDIGSATHDILLHGEGAVCVIEGFTDWRKDAAKERRDTAYSAHKIPLLEHQFVEVNNMVKAAAKAIRECPELQIDDLQAEGRSEQTYIWQEVNGIWCKVRPDWIRDDNAIILDIKTTGSADPDAFSRKIFQLGYDVQSVLYRRGVQSVEPGKHTPRFIMVAVETEPPYLCSFHSLDLMAEDVAVQKVEWSISKWYSCLRDNQWEAYPNRICYAEIPPWEAAKWEMRRQSHELCF
jgi:hypothetical protein